MQLEQYIELARKEKSFVGTRVVVVPNVDVAHQLVQFYERDGCLKIQLADCISAEESFLPMPDAVFHQLATELNKYDKLRIVYGLHAYLFLLSNEKRHLAFAQIKQLVDQSYNNAIILVSSFWKNDLETMFSNPGYQSGKQLVFLEGDLHIKDPKVVLVDNRWINIQPPNCDSFKNYLKTITDFPINEDEKIVVALQENDKTIAGLSDDVVQVHTIADFMRQFYAVDEKLPENTLNWILGESQRLNLKNALLAMRKTFFDDDLSKVLLDAPKFIAECDELKRPALLWCLKHSVKGDSYLYSVLAEPDMNGANFLSYYVVHTPYNLLKDKNATRFAEERCAAIKKIEERTAGFIGQFIERTNTIPLPQLLPWLGNNTKAEHQELIRRFEELGDTNVYRELQWYLEDYDFGTPELTNYFMKYRKFKLRDKLDDQFCRESFDLSSVSSFSIFQPRDSVLREYSQDKKTALLIVDAMGAEYLPLLIEMSSFRSIKIERQCVVLSHPPTSTRFNHIDWWKHEKLSEIKELDNIVHDGAERHQQKKHYENIVEVLDNVFREIFNVISRNTDRFERIILTADHGASRLAVLAHEENLARTLENPSNENPDDWRFVKVQQGKSCPDEFVETLDGNYWVVRGHNRLPKQGGKPNELHGGYTPEEMLVPFIVFSKSADITQSKPTKEQTKPPIKQLVEKNDFDI